MAMIVKKDFCTRTAGVSCRRCQIACPKGAISFADDAAAPVIDHDACSRCSVCMGVCDAFATESTDVVGLYRHVKKISTKGELAYITCKENVPPGFRPATNVTVLPCLGCIPPEMWTLLIAEKAPVCVVCDLRYCEDCARATRMGQLLFTHSVEAAEDWTSSDIHYDREMPEYEEQAHDQSKRGAIGSVKDDALGIVNGKRKLKNTDTLQNIYKEQERKRVQEALNLPDPDVLNHFVPSGHARRRMSPRRMFLLGALVSDPSIAENVVMDASVTDAQACDNCADEADGLACSNVCPTGARLPSATNGKLQFDPRYCIGCGLCVDACPLHAVTLEERTARQQWDSILKKSKLNAARDARSREEEAQQPDDSGLNQE
jgi:Fe-S-cluster-containing hydrogenase component 2